MVGRKAIDRDKVLARADANGVGPEVRQPPNGAPRKATAPGSLLATDNIQALVDRAEAVGLGSVLRAIIARSPASTKFDLAPVDEALCDLQTVVGSIVGEFADARTARTGNDETPSICDNFFRSADIEKLEPCFRKLCDTLAGANGLELGIHYDLIVWSRDLWIDAARCDLASYFGKLDRFREIFGRIPEVSKARERASRTYWKKNRALRNEAETRKSNNIETRLKADILLLAAKNPTLGPSKLGRMLIQSGKVETLIKDLTRELEGSPPDSDKIKRGQLDGLLKMQKAKEPSRYIRGLCSRALNKVFRA